jgi:hypothetical protein
VRELSDVVGKGEEFSEAAECQACRGGGKVEGSDLSRKRDSWVVIIGDAFFEDGEGMWSKAGVGEGDGDRIDGEGVGVEGGGRVGGRAYATGKVAVEGRFVAENLADA